jgi:hypothetical protein
MVKAWAQDGWMKNGLMLAHNRRGNFFVSEIEISNISNGALHVIIICLRYFHCCKLTTVPFSDQVAGKCSSQLCADSVPLIFR